MEPLSDIAFLRDFLISEETKLIKVRWKLSIN